MPCEKCRGAGEIDGQPCTVCRGSRFQMLTCCPFDEIPPDVRDVIDLAEDAERGLQPVAGGVLDQSATFNRIRRIIRADKAYFLTPPKRDKHE